jgi:hypothetical protein
MAASSEPAVDDKLATKARLDVTESKDDLRD